jgi:hypothetical protein
MKVVLLVLLGAIVLALAAYFFLFLNNGFVILRRSNGGSIVFQRTSISLEPPPDHYTTDAFDHIESYVSRLLAPSGRFKSVSIFTPNGQHGFGLFARDGKVEASLYVEQHQEAKRETTIRTFFKLMGIDPSQDYLAANGGVPDATRCLSYPITGSTAEVTALTKRILQELCGVSPTEALDIGYSEK